MSRQEQRLAIHAGQGARGSHVEHCFGALFPPFGRRPVPLALFPLGLPEQRCVVLVHHLPDERDQGGSVDFLLLGLGAPGLFVGLGGVAPSVLRRARTALVKFHLLLERGEGCFFGGLGESLALDEVQSFDRVGLHFEFSSGFR